MKNAVGFIKATRIILALACVFSMLFIWSNSLDKSAESTKKSDRVVENVEPIINPDNTLTHDEVSYIVRKSAHFLEFALLGFLAEAFYLSLRDFNLKKIGFHILFVPLFVFAVALIDETIQRFNDRTNSFTDVLIDFSGGLSGIFFSAVIVFLVASLVKKLRQKVQRIPK